MLKACSCCGKLHRFEVECSERIAFEQKRQSQYDRNKYRYRRDSSADKFRNSKAWQRKRQKIKDRDLNICRYCFLKHHRIVTAGISVHHIVPIETNFDMRLSDKNLISLCRDCHEKAESKRIPADELKALVEVPLKLL